MSGVVSESELAEEPPGTIEKIRLDLKIQIFIKCRISNLWQRTLKYMENGRKPTNKGFSYESYLLNSTIFYPLL